MGKSTISMAIFNSYVKLPEGNRLSPSLLWVPWVPRHAQITVVPESIHSESNHLRWKITTIHDDFAWPKHTRTWTRWFQVETSANLSAFHCISLRSPNCKQKLAVYVYIYIYMNICYIYIYIYLYVYIYPDHVVRTYYKTVGIIHKYVYIYDIYIYICMYYVIYIYMYILQYIYI